MAKIAIAVLFLAFLFPGCGTGEESETSSPKEPTNGETTTTDLPTNGAQESAMGTSSGPDTSVKRACPPVDPNADVFERSSHSEKCAALLSEEFLNAREGRTRVIKEKFIHVQMSSTVEDVEFECSTDKAEFVKCSSLSFLATCAPSCQEREFGPFGEGEHTLEVRAVDTNGKKDTTPAVYEWIVDLTTPTFGGAVRGEAVPLSKYCSNDERRYDLLVCWTRATDNYSAADKISYGLCISSEKGGCAKETDSLAFSFGLNPYCFKDSQCVYTRGNPLVVRVWPVYVAARARDEVGNWDANEVEICVSESVGGCI